MPELNDHELLAEFARAESEAAFATLVARYVNLVYSTALRFTGNSHHAEEITQAVFIILARKAGKLSSRVVLSGWLYQAARLTAANLVKGEVRRHHREQEAYMQSILNEPGTDWRQIAPLLDQAMGDLGETDRNAVVLRFFENKTAAEVAVALKLTEGAAHKRVNRALEKLRKFFTKRGVSSTTATIAGVISANSVHAAPATLAKAVTAIAVAKGVAASGSTLTLIKGALKIMAWTKMKTGLVIVMGVLLASTTATIVVKEVQEHITYPWQVNVYDGRVLEQASPQLKILSAKHPLIGGGWGIRNGKIMGLGLPIKYVIQAAYAPTYGSKHLSRITSTTELPKGRYDMIASLPSGNPEALQQEIRRKFGLIAILETNETDVLLLTAKSPNAPGFKPSPHNGNHMAVKSGKVSFSGADIGSLRLYLDEYFEVPVLDRTGLTENFDMTMVWDEPVNGKNPNALKEALVDQLGLELVPGRETIPMLVIEKAP